MNTVFYRVARDHMKHLIIASALGLASFVTMAQGASFTGSFGHKFTKTKGAAVWEIKATDGQYKLFTTSPRKPVQQSHQLSASERQKFWQSMWWSEESSVSASCVGNAEEVLCYVPPAVRNEIADLQSYESNYFHFDQMGGLMEAQKLSK